GVQDALLAFAIIGFIVAAVGWVIAIINLFFPLYTFKEVLVLHPTVGSIYSVDSLLADSFLLGIMLLARFELGCHCLLVAVILLIQPKKHPLFIYIYLIAALAYFIMIWVSFLIGEGIGPGPTRKYSSTRFQYNAFIMLGSTLTFIATVIINFKVSLQLDQSTA
ncbi:MAG: hypothetical protein EZS28_009440, partial [Streblomastix strix]